MAVCPVCTERPALWSDKSKRHTMCGYCYAEEVCGVSLHNKFTSPKFDICYSADSSTMNMDERYCEAYRAWALQKICEAYPEHEVRVVNEFKHGTFSTSTDDEENEQEIVAFVDNLWDSCDWDSVEKLVRQYALN